MEPYPAIAPLRPELNLQGKTVLITGGGKLHPSPRSMSLYANLSLATGIGLATSWAFAQAGVIILAIMARSEAQMAKAKKEIEAKHPGTQVKTCAASVTDAVAVDDFIKGLGVIDILILNAGVARAPSSVVDTNSDDLVNDFSINVFGNFNVLKAYLALPPRSADAKRTVVYTSTAGAYMAQPGFGAYSASKMAMSQLVRHVALEEANKGVRVFTIHPAATLTDMAKTVGFKEGQIQFDAGE